MNRRTLRGASLGGMLALLAAITGDRSALGQLRAKGRTASRPAPGPPTTDTTARPTLACVHRQDIEAWPLRRQAAQILMIAVQSSDLGPARSWVSNLQIGGLLVRGTSLTMGSDLQTLRTLADPPPILAADEEGGRAQRLRDVLGVLPSARRMAATLTTARVRVLARDHALKMRALGITMNLAPDVDLTDADNSIGTRSFSGNADITIAFATAFARGMIDGGVFPVLKHFPGHGSATGDSHMLQPDTPPLDVLRGADLLPFLAIPRRIDVGVMVGHLRVPGTDDLPATISSSLITGVLRNELGFRGLIVTDALSMLPIRARYSTPDAAVHALAAGADLLLFDEEKDVEPIVNGLAEAAADPIVARQLVDAVMQVLAAKGYRDCDGPGPARR